MQTHPKKPRRKTVECKTAKLKEHTASLVPDNLNQDLILIELTGDRKRNRLEHLEKIVATIEEQTSQASLDQQPAPTEPLPQGCLIGAVPRTRYREVVHQVHQFPQRSPPSVVNALDTNEFEIGTSINNIWCEWPASWATTDSGLPFNGNLHSLSMTPMAESAPDAPIVLPESVNDNMPTNNFAEGILSAVTGCQKVGSANSHTHSTDKGIQESNDLYGQLIFVYRPSGKIYAVRPERIRRYISSLTPNLRHQLLESAKTGEFRFIDQIVADLETHEGSPPSTSTSPNHSSTIFRRNGFLLSTPEMVESLSPYTNTLRIARLSYFSALFANFSALGFDFSLFLDENSISPYCTDNLSLPEGFKDTPVNLRPLSCQLSVPHHPYLDTLPFPTFRQRALAALSADPPLLNEDELCVDLMLKDGLVCWGSIGGGGMDRGSPWESRSWEAKGWFLRKWWWLVGGEDEEMWSVSRWWASQRGEKVSAGHRENPSDLPPGDIIVIR